MNPEDIALILRTAPFTPFKIHFSNQMSIEVKHPEALIIVDRRLEFYSMVRGDVAIQEHKFHYSIDHVVCVEMLERKGRPIDGSRN